MNRSVLFLALCALLLAGCAGSRPVDTTASGPVVLVSLDGFRYDYAARVPTPTLDRIAEEGARAQWLNPAYPTLTFPNHYTLVTGLYPEHHGIVGNHFYSPEKQAAFSYRDTAAVRDARWWGGEPIWATAEKQGVRAATVFWPGSEAAIGGVRPSHWLAYDDDLAYDARVDTLLAWLDLPAEKRPRLLTLYLSAVDNAGHRYGPESPEVDAAIERVDATLARLVEGLEARGLYEQATLIVVSDHGMSDMAAERVVYLDDYADVEAPSERVYWGEPLGVWPRAGKADSLYAVLATTPIPHAQVYRRETLPARLHFDGHAAAPPILVLAEPGWTLTTRARAAARPMEGHWGTHGFDNAAPEMRAIFYARGPRFKKGSVAPPLASIDVYPLLAHVLGLDPARVDGSLDASRAMLR